MANKSPIIKNPVALRDYHIEKRVEAGLQLKGNEVKSLRLAKANLRGSFAKLENGSVYICNLHINPYEFSADDYEPLRPRKLLLHKREINQVIVHISQQGYALVPIKIYFKRGYAKIELGFGKGKKLYDKRLSLKEKQQKRETEQAVKRMR
jgi:SsrA-binding protein